MDIDASLEIALRRLHEIIDFRAAAEHVLARRRLEHVHRSLGQRFRRAEEALRR